MQNYLILIHAFYMLTDHLGTFGMIKLNAFTETLKRNYSNNAKYYFMGLITKVMHILF